MIAAISASMNVTLNLITDQIEKTLDDLEKGGAIVAKIFNDAQSEEGLYYWDLVNNGRGPVRPINAKALHWVDPKTGKDVFAKYAGPSAPRHIRESSIPAIQQATIPGFKGALTRESLVELVNEIAEFAVAELQSRTPVVSGKLRSSYRIERAE
jgi:hypothetical protein